MKQLLYSPGEPAGIGIDSILYISKQSFWEQINARLVCIADPKLLESRSKILNLKIKFKELHSIGEAKKNKIGIVQFIKVAECLDCSPGKLNPTNAKYVIKNLNFGIEQTLKNKKIELANVESLKLNLLRKFLIDFH